MGMSILLQNVLDYLTNFAGTHHVNRIETTGCILKWFTALHSYPITHLSTNRARCKATLLIKTRFWLQRPCGLLILVNKTEVVQSQTDAHKNQIKYLKYTSFRIPGHMKNSIHNICTCTQIWTILSVLTKSKPNPNRITFLKFLEFINL